MTTNQIIILLILFTVFVISFLKVMMEEKGYKRDVFGVALLLSFACTMTLAAILVIERNSFKSPCPELQKIENVYKIK